MITYLIKSGLCLALVLLVYKVLLERERVYVFNRYYLLFGLCFSFVVPFIPMVSSVAIPLVENNSGLVIKNTVALPLNISSQEASNPISWMFYLIGLYAIGSLFFFSRFTSNIYKIFRKIAQNTKALYKKASLVLLKENVVPHTFLHYIFIDKEAHDSSTIANELYTHELAHVSQKHTLDIILIELIQIVFWFNPLLIYYKKAIQLNHEFLADDAVLKTNTKIPTYQQLLLDNASWNHNLYLASNLNFSVTKKRLQMMTKHTSRVRAWLVASLTIPIFMGALFLFSTKVIAKETTTATFESSETKMITHQDPIASYYKNATFVFENENGTKVTKTYAELTDEEKAKLIPPPKAPAAKRPTSKLLNNWKDKEGYAIWLDGKVIDNTEISNHDIVHYTGSFVHKNARSKRFPQTYQMHLYTALGFENLKEELANPLSEGAVLHFKKGSHQVRLGKKKVSDVTDVKIIEPLQNELTKINKLPINYVNEKNGPNETELPTKVEEKKNHTRKDIVVHITKDGAFIVNHKLKSNFNGLDKNIKAELSTILHKKARNSIIIYHKNYKSFITKVTSVLKANKIYDIETINIADLPPPPPPPVPEKLVVVGKEVKVPAPKKIVVVGKEVKVPAPKKPMIKEVKIPDAPTVQETKDIARMHRNIKGHKLETMMINGKKHYYVIKNDYKYIYNEKSQLVDENGKLLPPPPPPPAKQKKKG
jgi:beta-lactamase regulating signal transducer with metallopeptidase domain